jgi:hypothetical protein
MSNDQFDDLKQFIQTQISESENRITKKMDTQISESENRITKKMDTRISQSAMDTLEDLKQFVDSRTSQSEVRTINAMDEKISQTETRLEEKIDELREEMRDGFAGVGEAIEDIHARLDANDEEHKHFIRRPGKLKPQTA